MQNFVDHSDNGNELLNWTKTTDAKLDRAIPTSNDIDTLSQEIDNYKVRLKTFLQFRKVTLSLGLYNSSYLALWF